MVKKKEVEMGRGGRNLIMSSGMAEKNEEPGISFHAEKIRAAVTGEPAETSELFTCYARRGFPFWPFGACPLGP